MTTGIQLWSFISLDYRVTYKSHWQYYGLYKSFLIAILGRGGVMGTKHTQAARVVWEWSPHPAGNLIVFASFSWGSIPCDPPPKPSTNSMNNTFVLKSAEGKKIM